MQGLRLRARGWRRTLRNGAASLDRRTKVRRYITFGRWTVLAALAVPLIAQQAPPPIWQSDMPPITELVNKVRAGKDLTPKKWPNGGKVAVALSFDFDAETLF